MTGPPMLLDAHCHLNFAAFDGDRDAVLARARTAGVRQLIIAGYDAQRRALAAELAQDNPGIFCCAGLHPWALRGHEQDERWLCLQLELLRDALANHPSSWCAVGECGLDHHIATTQEERTFQERAFVEQVRLANAAGLPLVIHAVKCHERLRELLDATPPAHGGIMHGYSGSAAMMPAFLAHGLGLSFGTPLAFKGYEKLKKAFRRILVEAPTKWMLETDAPDRAVPSRGRAQRGEPADVWEVACAAAEVAGMDARELAAHATANARAMFGLPPDASLAGGCDG